MSLPGDDFSALSGHEFRSVAPPNVPRGYFDPLLRFLAERKRNLIVRKTAKAAKATAPMAMPAIAPPDRLTECCVVLGPLIDKLLVAEDDACEFLLLIKETPEDVDSAVWLLVDSALWLLVDSALWLLEEAAAVDLGGAVWPGKSASDPVGFRLVYEVVNIPSSVSQ